MLRQVVGLVCMAFLVTGVWAAEQNGPPLPEAPGAAALVLPAESHGLVYVVRETGKKPHLPMDVYVDKAEGKNRLGYTLGGQHIYFQVLPGEHTLISIGKNTKTIRMDVKAGETLFVKQNERLDYKDGSNQDVMEILIPEAGKYLVAHTAKGWIDEEHPAKNDTRN